jgi:hypothetical protein
VFQVESSIIVPGQSLSQMQQRMPVKHGRVKGAQQSLSQLRKI